MAQRSVGETFSLKKNKTKFVKSENLRYCQWKPRKRASEVTCEVDSNSLPSTGKAADDVSMRLNIRMSTFNRMLQMYTITTTSFLNYLIVVSQILRINPVVTYLHKFLEKN